MCDRAPRGALVVAECYARRAFDQTRGRLSGGLSYLRADPSDLEVLDGGSEEERAPLIAQRLREWKSAANTF